MATRAPAALLWLARRWEDGIDSAMARQDAATFAGIVGDPAHRATGGYHISLEDLIAAGMSGDYSIAQFTDDRRGPADCASAVDMTMSTAAMRLVTGRLAAAWRAQDPRLDAVRGFNGTLDGVHALRWDASNPDPNTVNAATGDHLWHVHLEVFRRWCDDMTVAAGILGVILGDQTVQAQVHRRGVNMIFVRSGGSIVATDWATWCDRTIPWSQIQAMNTAGVPLVDVTATQLGRILALPQPGQLRLPATVEEITSHVVAGIGSHPTEITLDAAGVQAIAQSAAQAIAASPHTPLGAGDISGIAAAVVGEVARLLSADRG